MLEIIKLSDKKLYSLCVEYGTNAKDWLKRFGGLLPEVYRRRLYRQHNCASIHEFAKKIAGMHERTVDKILNLAAKLEDKPYLRKQLESGIGWSKIETVAYIATPQNDKTLAEMTKKFSRKILLSYVKTKRHEEKEFTAGGQAENKNPISQPSNRSFAQPPLGQQFYRQHDDRKTFSFHISPNLEQKLRLFKQNLEKYKKETLSWNEVFQSMEYRATCSLWKQEKILIRLCPNCAREKGKNAATRHIPSDVKKILKVKFGNMCAYKNCTKPAEEYHHIKRFAQNKSHDPDYIVPLCKEHHNLAHTGLIANEQEPPEKWRLN